MPTTRTNEKRGREASAGGILNRAKRGQMLSGKQQSRNRRWTSVRANVEHTFECSSASGAIGKCGIEDLRLSRFRGQAGVRQARIEHMNETNKLRRRFDETFKREAVALLLQSGKSAKQLATELGRR